MIASNKSADPEQEKANLIAKSKPIHSLPNLWKPAEMSAPHVDDEKLLEMNLLKDVKTCSTGTEPAWSSVHDFLVNLFRHAVAK